MPEFTGYPPGTLKFLKELEANNSSEWFAGNRERYEEMVREPSLDFIAGMGPELQKISEAFVAIPKKVGGSLMRVHRDVRFSKDKTPYKTNIGIQFRHELGKDVHAPGYYMHIDNTGCFLAAGVWRPDSQALGKIRGQISEQTKAWQKVLSTKAFRTTFELGGTSLKRPPRGFDADQPHIEDLKRKDFIAVTNFAAKDVQSQKFLKQTAGVFGRASGFMEFLCAALEVDY